MVSLIKEKSNYPIEFSALETTMAPTATLAVSKQIDLHVISMETECVMQATRMQQMAAQIVYQPLSVVSNSSISFTVNDLLTYMKAIYELQVYTDLPKRELN